MKNIIKAFLMVLGITTLLTACDKAEDLPFYEKGSASVLSASANTIAPPAADSNKVALTLSWTFPNYATDSSNVKYIIEIDSATKNFSNPYRKEVIGELSTTFLAKELNTMLLAREYAFNKEVTMEVRLISSHVNNNERITGNTLQIKMTPYKVPPKVALPASGKLYIVGGATIGDWNNPVPTPTQEFTRVDETTFIGIFEFKGGSEYLILPENGVWSKKYALQDNTVAGIDAGGSFGYHEDGQPAPDVFQSNFKGPATPGFYKVVLDFQQGKFTVTPFTQQHGLPGELFLIGNATTGDDAGWGNPVPVPARQFTRVTSTKFELTHHLTTGKEFLFIPENGSWAKKFGIDGDAATGNLGGTLKPEGGNMPAPTVSGNYKITVDFATNTYTLVKL